MKKRILKVAGIMLAAAIVTSSVYNMPCTYVYAAENTTMEENMVNEQTETTTTEKTQTYNDTQNSIAITATEWAKLQEGSRYSQCERMSGYTSPEEEVAFDASSLVWRAYKHAGFNIGDKTIAPTCADMAEWLTENGYEVTVSSENPLNDLQPGDIIFSSFKDNTGRYKDITSAQIYTGEGKSIYAKNQQCGIVHEKTFTEYAVTYCRITE